MRTTPGLLSHVVLSALALSVGVSAQRQWIVDAAGGPNAGFTALAPAFAVAADGDTVTVRAGRYGPGTVTAALRILFEPGARVLHSNRSALRIQGIAAGQVCTVRGLEARLEFPFVSGSALEVADCDGVVVIEGLDLRSRFTGPEGLLLRDCASVYITRSVVQVAVGCVGSSLTLTASELSTALGPALRSEQSRVEVTDCSLRGGVGSGFNPAHAIHAVRGSRITVRGSDAARSIDGGVQLIAPAGVFAAIGGDATSALLLDPAVSVLPPPVGFGSFEQRAMPVVSASLQAGSLGLELRSAPRAAFALLVGFPGLPRPVPGFGVLWTDPRTTAVLASGVLSPAGLFSRQIGVATSSASVGLGFSFQAAVASAQGVVLSNAAVIVSL